MSDQSVTEMSRRAPAVLVLLALLALVVSVCHGSHGHVLPPTSGTVTTVSAPALPHGCERSGDAWTFDAHLPAQAAASPLAAPGAGGAAVLPYEADLRTDPRARCVRNRAGPGPEPGRLLIALGVDRN
ncbi:MULTISPECIES: hypothetical protein [Streptomyces]|jgi:hypothetical protein|uniref:Uncharacterized protein n=1 Tax=Streptomyces nymphaeiformis TaxID=2663842 RepID=A0A7W7U0B4_9ACTN|nr:hypothetical protein [Streptomyces nymphaeiformis]MBB4982626.1 hypothetical protein [Streptomyces nymphaeiformis]